MSQEGFRIPPRHSQFEWRMCLVMRHKVDEILRRYDSGEQLEDIEAAFKRDGTPNYVVEGILYQARPQRLIALGRDGEERIEIGVLDPFRRDRVLRWITRYCIPCGRPESFWGEPHEARGVWVMKGGGNGSYRL